MANRLHRTMTRLERPATWVARASGIQYKRVLAEVVHRTSPLRLETALAVSAALGTSLPEVLADVTFEAAAA